MGLESGVLGHIRLTGITLFSQPASHTGTPPGHNGLAEDIIFLQTAVLEPQFAILG